jgi:cysteine desulfurase
LVSLAAANHELGNVYATKKIVAAVRRVRTDVVVHCDAVQAFGKEVIDMRDLDVDALSLSAHKVFGPPGVGALVVRSHVELAPQSYGGEQERGRRRGSENTPAIAGFGRAAELAREERDERRRRTVVVYERLRSGIERALVPIGARIEGDAERHVGNTLCVSLPGCPGELLVMAMDLEGVAISAGAACSSGRSLPSSVLIGLGRSEVEAREAVRFSCGPSNSVEEIDRVLAILPGIVARVRASNEGGSGHEGGHS